MDQIETDGLQGEKRDRTVESITTEENLWTPSRSMW